MHVSLVMSMTGSLAWRTLLCLIGFLGLGFHDSVQRTSRVTHLEQRLIYRHDALGIMYDLCHRG
ncbi:hypothetical protein M405DRAFT_813378, partial [Rhizopogon salebrosus TDB-379]